MNEATKAVIDRRLKDIAAFVEAKIRSINDHQVAINQLQLGVDKLNQEQMDLLLSLKGH